MTQTYDNIIIGGGPGGYELAALLAAKGEKTALIEADLLGGTCLNRGCIPTKTLCHAASMLRLGAAGTPYGITFQKPGVDWSALMSRKDEVTAALREGIAMQLAGVEVINSMASLRADHMVQLSDGTTLSAPRIVIATGSVPASLPVPGAELAVNSDRLLDLDSLPGSIAIIGGGVIGIEFASIFSAFGCKVSVIEYCREILPQIDKDIARRLRRELEAQGIEFHLGSQVTAIPSAGAVEFTAKGESVTVEADMVAMAIGRRPNLPEGLAEAGVETGPKGIKVDPDTLLTTAPDIYAIGDVNGISMLAHAASAQARRVAGLPINLDVIPAAVFTSPEVATVGLTEEMAKELHPGDCAAMKLPLRSNGKAVSMGEDSGLIKLIAQPSTGHILGCHILAPHAADIIQSVALAISNGLTLTDIAATIHIHPSLSEIIPAAIARLNAAR